MIRQATEKDAEAVARLMLQAMEKVVFHLIGKQNRQQATQFLQTLFVQRGNQYSFENTLVYEQGTRVVGSLVWYSGAQAARLVKPVLELCQSHYHHFPSIEAETQAGEYYIDTLSVDKNFQNKGIGSELLGYLIQNLPKGTILGLLVDNQNLPAQRLYLRLGFTRSGEKTLANQVYQHFVLRI